MANADLQPIIKYTQQLMDLPAFKVCPIPIDLVRRQSSSRLIQATFDVEYLVNTAKTNMAQKKAEAEKKA